MLVQRHSAEMSLLEDLASMEIDHSDSLLGAIEALKASTLLLPVVGGATANVLGLKDAIGSTVDVMHRMGSSICLLLPVVEEVNVLVTAKTQTMHRFYFLFGSHAVYDQLNKETERRRTDCTQHSNSRTTLWRQQRLCDKRWSNLCHFLQQITLSLLFSSCLGFWILSSSSFVPVCTGRNERVEPRTSKSK